MGYLGDWSDDGPPLPPSDFPRSRSPPRRRRTVASSGPTSGAVRIGDAELLGFMTTWGDGAFDVQFDEDDDGRAVAIRIVFER